METPSKIYKVAIVGAGISGLSAARHLLKNGISESDIIILEAEDKPGGRISTIEFGNGLVELGAQWIHGERNEFCQLVKSSGHRHAKSWWEGKGDFLCPDGRRVENEVVDEVLGWLEDRIEQVEETFSIETLAQSNNMTASTSMGEYLLDSFRSHLKDNFPEMEESSPEYSIRMTLFQWGMSFQRIDNSCDRMNDVSLYRWSEFEVNPGEHYNNFGRGAQSFVDEVLVADLHHRIRLKSAVKNIEWGEKNRADGGVNHIKVKVENGTVILSETVLVTCSIACLKSNLDSLFTPNLPEKLSRAINSTGFGPVAKIFLGWNEPWWPSDLKGFQLMWPNEYIDCCGGESKLEDAKDNWHKAITGFDPVLDNPNVLLGWLGGPEAVYAEGLSEDEIGRKCVEQLRNFTGLQVPDVDSVAISKWSKNQFFQGAYSFRSVEGDMTPGDICSVLCEPVLMEEHNGINKPVIVLAGEALSKTHYSTLHGAYESGMSQGNKILQYFANSTKTSAKIAKVIQVRNGEDNQNIHTSQENNGDGRNFLIHLIAANSNGDIKVPL